MSKLAPLLVVLALVACSSTSHEPAPSKQARTPTKSTPDPLVHITGCENGELMVPIVRLWNKPGGLAADARPVGQVSGDGRADRGLKCQGSIVIIRDSRTVSGRKFYKIETVVGSQTGWVTDSFIGRRFDRSQCASHFKSDPEYIPKCERG